MAFVAISVPVALNYLGSERYGLWMVATSVIAMLRFCDLGLGSSTLNAVAYATGTGNLANIRGIVSSSFFTLTAVSIVIGSIFYVIYPWVPWARIYGAQSLETASITGTLTAAIVGAFLIGLPLTLVRHVQFGLQEGYRANFWDGAGNLLAIVFLATAVLFKLGLVTLAAGVALAPAVTRLMNAIVYLRHRRPALTPLTRQFHLPIVRQLLRSGGLFFTLQVAALLAFQADNLIIAHILGPRSVTHYAIPLQLFEIPTLLFGLILSALWPAYTEAHARGDVQWIRKTYATTMRYTVGCGLIFSLTLYAVGAPLVRIWTAGHVTPTHPLLLALAAWSLLSMIGNANSTVLNALHVVRFQVVIATIMAVVNITLSIYLVHRVGILGAILGTTISYSVFSLIPALYYAARLLNRMGHDAQCTLTTAG